MDEKAVFTARDLSVGSSSAMSSGSKKYMGEERRRTTRRSGLDRRTDVRFEPGKEDRRRSAGRRLEDDNPQFW